MEWPTYMITIVLGLLHCNTCTYVCFVMLTNHMVLTLLGRVNSMGRDFSCIFFLSSFWFMSSPFLWHVWQASACISVPSILGDITAMNECNFAFHVSGQYNASGCQHPCICHCLLSLSDVISSESTRRRAFMLISQAYSSIEAEDCASYAGLSVNETVDGE